jgi:uncharacterized membrane protein YgdD (TMEM256/DUF423 family)
MNVKNTLLAGAVFAFLSVALGAFGAHAFKPMLLASGRLDTYELAARYQFYHSLALLITGILQHVVVSRLFRYASLMFSSGIVLFSGSLYLLCFTNNSSFAMVTPVGGLFFMTGWFLLGLGIYKNIKQKRPSL